MPSYHTLSRANKRLYNRLIVRPHRRRVELHVLTLNGVHRGSLTPDFIDGTITTDVDQAPMQVAQMTFVEPTRSLVFEPDAPGEASMHRSYMIRVNDARWIRGLGWVDCDVFTGPLWTFKRTGAEVQLTAHSVDRLAMGDIRRARQWLRKTRKTTVIKELFNEFGATKVRCPDLRFTTPVHVHVGTVRPKKKGEKAHKVRRRTGFEVTHEDTYWDKITALSNSMDRLAFPTADGGFDVRSRPERPSYHFHGAALMSDVAIERSANDGPNTFIVVGAKPKGSKRRVTSGKVGFPKGHPLSASSLAVDGKPYEIIDTEHNPHCKTIKECRARAIRRRDRAMRMLADVSFDAMPIPWLRPLDLVTAQAGWGIPSVHIRQLSYPLATDGTPMSVGSTKKAIPKEWKPRRRAA